jgi:hypothetical protein
MRTFHNVTVKADVEAISGLDRLLHLAPIVKPAFPETNLRVARHVAPAVV